MRKFVTLGALALCTQITGCFFFYVRVPQQAAQQAPEAPQMTRANLTACRSLDKAQRAGTFADEQAAKRETASLNLNDADCKRMLAEADK